MPNRSVPSFCCPSNHGISVTIAELRAHWLSEAAHVRPYNAGAAFAFEQAARELEEAMRQAEAETLTLAEAAREANMHPDSLRHLVSAGKIPNAGKRGAPRIRRKDLSRRAGATASSGYDPNADALRLVSGARPS
jgi:hypothetical protein